MGMQFLNWNQHLKLDLNSIPYDDVYIAIVRAHKKGKSAGLTLFQKKLLK